jgi:putative transposase
VYNAGLQERRDAWRRSGTRVRLFDQFNQLRHLRGVRDDTLAWGVQPLRGALRRLDEAYAAFFRRCANGQTPGHPRFRSWRRFDTVCWDEPTSWNLDLDTGRLHLQGVGHIRLPKGALRQLRRLAARGGVPTTLTVTRRRAGTGWAWRTCVGFTDVAATHTTPTGGDDSVVGADRGVAVTLALSDGQMLAMPGFVAEARDEIAELMRARDGKTVGSRAWKHLNRKVAKAYRQAKHRSDNWARQTAKDLVERHGVVVLEDLKLANMTRSARGTKGEPGAERGRQTGVEPTAGRCGVGQVAALDLRQSGRSWAQNLGRQPGQHEPHVCRLRAL